MPEPGPFPDKLKCPSFQVASKHLPIHRDGGAAPCMVCMEMDHRVVSLVPVHVDQHPVECADSRHSPTIARVPARWTRAGRSCPSPPPPGAPRKVGPQAAETWPTPGGQRTLPGLRRPAGSRAFLIARCTATESSPSSRASHRAGQGPRRTRPHRRRDAAGDARVGQPGECLRRRSADQRRPGQSGGRPGRTRPARRAPGCHLIGPYEELLAVLRRDRPSPQAAGPPAGRPATSSWRRSTGTARQWPSDRRQ